MTDEKFCPRCKQTLPVSEFPKNRSRADGYHSYCKICHRDQTAASHAKNPDKHRKYSAEYYHRNRDKMLEYIRQYRKEHPPDKTVERERNKEWRHRTKQDRLDNTVDQYFAYLKYAPIPDVES